MYVTIKMINKAKDGKPLYSRDKEIEYVIHYAISKKKVDERVRFWGAKGLSGDVGEIAKQMIVIQKIFRKANQRRVYHMVVSFPLWVKNMPFIKSVAEEIASYIFRSHQVVYGIHEDTKQRHIHFVFNAVSYVDGKKFHKNRIEFEEMKKDIRTIVEWQGKKYGID